jgi:hypothetical protein
MVNKNMKQVHLFLIAAVLCSALAYGGGKDADGIIAMTTNADSAVFWLEGSGTVTVDWGDGSEKETMKIAFAGNSGDDLLSGISHRYSGTLPRIIPVHLLSESFLWL